MNVKEFEQELHDLETRVDRLKALYEQWFSGMERLEPTVPRKDVERRMQALRREIPRNTAMRFRFQQLLQKYTTYGIYWKRVARQIEEGTYRRDLLRARRRREQMRQTHESGSVSSPAPVMELDEDDIDIDAIFDEITGVGDDVQSDARATNRPPPARAKVASQPIPPPPPAKAVARSHRPKPPPPPPPLPNLRGSRSDFKVEFDEAPTNPPPKK
ncbi:MAG: hypothetical protein IPJ88_05605 [Myxococcales bacterium]|nr:MAG: hypothetical protein IPJ88_05605 [Myxococcales bacterium]